MESLIFLDPKEIQAKLNSNSNTSDTIRLYFNNIRIFLSFIKNEYETTEPVDIKTFIKYADSFFEYSFKKGLSVSSVNRHIAAINFYLKTLNIPEKLSFYKVNSYNTMINTECEDKLTDILNKRIKIKDRFIIYLFIYEGFISEDMCNLKIEDINLDDDTILKSGVKVKMNQVVKQCYLQYVTSRFFKINKENYLFYYRSKMTPSAVSRIINKYNLSPRELRNLFYCKVINIISSNEPEKVTEITKISDEASELMYKYVPELKY